MAKIFPTIDKNLISNAGEREVYESISKLSNDYLVFYSFRWLQADGIYSRKYGEADFIIIHPNKGVAVIEVKSGSVYLVDGKWYYQNGIEMNDPIEQANASLFKLRDELKNRYQNSTIGFASAVWFPHLHNEAVPSMLPFNYSRVNILTRENLDNPEKSISSLLKTTHQPFPIDMERIREILLPSFNLVKSISNSIAVNNEVIHLLTAEQSKLIDYLEEQESAVIHGAAGTGKTLIAVEKAERIASKTNKVLLICYNRYLKEELDLRITNPYVEVHNINSLASKLLNHYDVTEDDLIAFLESTNQENFGYQSVIVDEAQDFSEELIILLGLHKTQSFYLFYDKHQLIQKQSIPSWLQDADCRLILSKNCRNTISIAKTSTSPIKIVTKKHLRAVEGIKPYIVTNNDTDILLDSLYRTILNLKSKEGIKPEQFIVLTVKTEEKSILNNSNVLRKLQNLGIKFTTARKFKGLEADIVLIVDLDQDFFDSNQANNILYVASSRAKNLLYLYFNCNDDESNDIAQRIDDVPRTKDGAFAISRALNGQVYKE